MGVLNVSSVRRLLVGFIAFFAIVFGTSSNARAQCTGVPLLCRQCLLIGHPIFFFPGDPGPQEHTLQTLYTETGPFLAQPGSTTNISAQMTATPPLSSSPEAELVAAAMLETMGYCEGPDTFSQVGDGGTVTTNFGPCGTLTDNFTVVSDGTTAPYQIQHSLSGSLTLNNLTLPPVGEGIGREAAIDIEPTSASGEVKVFSNTFSCAGTFSGTYTTHPSTPTSIPFKCVIRSPWTSFAASSNIASGTVVRLPQPYGLTSVTPSSGPTVGGTPVSLCGPGICTTTGVTFGGVAATNLACSGVASCPGPDYPLLAVTPAHAAGAVTVVATNGSATASLTNGYTYVTPSVPALPSMWIVAALAALLGGAGWWVKGRKARGGR
jgi:hypothetical protein